MLPLSGRLYTLSSNRIKFLVSNFHKVKYVKESSSSVVVIRGKKDFSNLHQLVKPVAVTSNPDDISAGDLEKKFNKKDLIKVLNTFFQKPETTALAQENGLSGWFIIIYVYFYFYLFLIHSPLMFNFFV